MTYNSYALYIDQMSYGPMTSVIRGVFRTKITSKNDLGKYEFLKERRLTDMALVDATTGAVLVAHAKVINVDISKDKTEVHIQTDL